MHKLLEQYKTQIVPAMKEKFNIKNEMAVPKLMKLSINIGTSKALRDASYWEVMENVITRISGQKPVKTMAKKSISNFKIRKGQVVGMKVTLRNKRMYDFLDKLINVTLPRVSDFHGVPDRVIDRNGNLSLGFKEYTAFPEIRSDEIEKLHGLEITVATNAKNHDQGLELFRLMGFPFEVK